MIQSLKVDNFKSLVDFAIDFHENSVIILRLFWRDVDGQ